MLIAEMVVPARPGSTQYNSKAVAYLRKMTKEGARSRRMGNRKRNTGSREEIFTAFSLLTTQHYW